ncbi:Alpha/Beta hydrolase protein [Aspergillus pseudotamarii]|uniref:Alpha/Beta hydrolase protein n=1 Tax=Aspergillus pseudotamarii TaxID=132259 RepID=A0A5N6SI81_ASPPS|nr:Alpha/Beta hydrolase protein [Aspergillus pseudotamarii]KAE8134335.1 Alpha/Beta hydrolase protein [Aspergillus pseudotamarii]
MYLPSPTYSFTIPSLHDETPLDCRLYLPHHSSLQLETIRGAIIAHPYAPLGGCYDDPVVSFVGGELLKTGYIVGTFNFRGAGTSGGRTSWTAKPELADYVSFYGFMLCYLHSLRSQEVSQRGDGSIPGGANVDVPDAQFTLDWPDIHLILGGYSYGSLIASHLPALDVVADLFKDIIAGTEAHEILQTAVKVSALLEANGSTQEQNLASEDHLAVEEPLDISGTTISYLLVSPLLPPLNLFLTFFSTMFLDIGARSPAQRRQIPCPKPTRQLCARPSLAIYGNQDSFTSASKLKKWSDELSHVPGSQFQSAEIDGAGHFWREDGVESQARDALGKWLRLIP